jgi:hypothetical protein
LLIWFAYRGWSVLLLAPAGAAIAVVFAGFPLLASWTQISMGGTAACESARVRREFSSVVRSNALLRAKDRCEACGWRQQLELHHVGHRGDASLFNCLVLRTLPPSRARTSPQCAPSLGEVTSRTR